MILFSRVDLCLLFKDPLKKGRTEGTQWRSWWLSHCATSRWVAGSIPNYVIFHWNNPSDNVVPLEYTLPVTEMSTRNISWG